MEVHSSSPAVSGMSDLGQMDSATLRGRRLVSWRDWNNYGVGIYERGEGEAVWRSSQHRLVFSLVPRPPLTLQFEGGPVRILHQETDAVGVYPAGMLARIVGTNAHYAQVSWSPELYRSVSPHLTRPPEIGPDFYPDPLLRQLIRALIHEIGLGMVDRLLADSLITSIAMRVAQRFSPPYPEQGPDLLNPRLTRVLDYMEANLDQDLTLSELASVACLSPYHFSRSFKKAMGVGPQRYTVQRRIERAKRLLRWGPDTLAGVAAAAGFADQSHFTNIFRRETGVTPGRFRSADR